MNVFLTILCHDLVIWRVLWAKHVALELMFWILKVGYDIITSAASRVIGPGNQLTPISTLHSLTTMEIHRCIICIANNILSEVVQAMMNMFIADYFLITSLVIDQSLTDNFLLLCQLCSPGCFILTHEAVDLMEGLDRIN